jgi:hypothetical protein
MKREQLARANKIAEDIERIKELDKLLMRATSGGNHLLAAVQYDCYDHFTVCDRCNIPPIILTKFRQVLADEAEKLDEEFEAL